MIIMKAAIHEALDIWADEVMGISQRLYAIQSCFVKGKLDDYRDLSVQAMSEIIFSTAVQASKPVYLPDRPTPWSDMTSDYWI